jgi:hypothetical protein
LYSTPPAIAVVSSVPAAKSKGAMVVVPAESIGPVDVTDNMVVPLDCKFKIPEVSAVCISPFEVEALRVTAIIYPL